MARRLVCGRRLLVVISAFLAGLFRIGSFKAYGVLIEDLTLNLQATTAFVGMAVAMSHGSTYCLSIINIVLLRHFSKRQLIMTGGLVGSAGIVLSSLARNGAHFAGSLLLSGLGYSLVEVPTRIGILEFFPDNFEIVISIVLTGGGVGMMVLPVLIEQFDVLYGWRGAVLITGGLSSVVIVGGAVMKMTTISRHPKKGKDNSDDVNRLQPLLEHDSGHCKLDSDLRHIKASTMSTNRNDNSNVDNKADCGEEICSMIKRFAHFVDLRIYYDYPEYILMNLSYITTTAVYTAWILFVIANAEAKGIPPYQAVLLATFGGAANIVGRFLIGFFSSRKVISDYLTLVALCFFCGTALVLNIISHSFWSLALFASINGFAIGAKTSLWSFLPRTVIPDKRYASSASFLNIVGGISQIASGALMGWIFDMTHSYDIAFVVAGIMDFIGGLLIFPLQLRRLFPTRSSREQGG